MYGLDGFKVLLSEFRSLSLTVLSAGVVVPFAASLASLSPPWPKAITGVTAVAELVALVIVYQLLRTSSKEVISRTVTKSAFALAVLLFAYLAADSLFTYETRTVASVRLVQGFECTADAKLVFPDRCPFLSIDDMRSAEYEPDRLWTPASIMAARLTLVSLWLAMFFALSVLLGSFLVHQSRQQRRSGPSGN